MVYASPKSLFHYLCQVAEDVHIAEPNLNPAASIIQCLITPDHEVVWNFRASIPRVRSRKRQSSNVPKRAYSSKVVAVKENSISIQYAGDILIPPCLSL